MHPIRAHLQDIDVNNESKKSLLHVSSLNYPAFANADQVQLSAMIGAHIQGKLGGSSKTFPLRRQNLIAQCRDIACPPPSIEIQHDNFSDTQKSFQL